MRILIVCAPARAGGLETVVEQLAVTLRTRGQHVAVVTVLDQYAEEADYPLISRLRAGNVLVHPIRCPSRGYLGERRAVARIAREMDADVVHTHGYRADILHGSIARNLSVAHVATVHGFVANTWRDKLYEWLQKRSLRRATKVIVVSGTIGDRLYQSGVASNVCLIPNAIGPAAAGLSREESRATLGLPANAFLVGWIGRLSREKGPDLFLKMLEQANRAIHGVLLGDGPERLMLAAAATKESLSGRVHFSGARVTARRYLAAFDALVLTSRTEGTPMVLLEAMHAKVPIATFAVGGVPAILDETQALIVPPMDTRALVDAVESIRTDPREAERRAEHAHLRVREEFSLDRWADSHETLYREAITKRIKRE